MTASTRDLLAATFRTAPHGPVTVEDRGDNTYRLRCDDPRHPADLTTVTSPGGVKQWRLQHESDGARVEPVRVESGDLL